MEILGKGNQVVGYGIHPETGNPYEWVGDSEPLLTSFGEFPAVTPNQIRELAETIREECARLGYKVKASGSRGVSELQAASQGKHGRGRIRCHGDVLTARPRR